MIIAPGQQTKVTIRSYEARDMYTIELCVDSLLVVGMTLSSS